MDSGAESAGGGVEHNNLTANDLATADREFRRRETILTAPPTRFYLNLTERCSLRCGHCITRAPERTADGTGREMGPEVIEALRPHLRHVAYLGLPHAGEPLIASQLEPLLSALLAARGEEPTVTHVLTNGRNLDLDRFGDLVELGINSWSFSVDGMRPETHDRLRQGSSIERLVPLIRQVAELRRRVLPWLRVGIAWTVTASNLHQVRDVVCFAADVGLDWVKLEEIYPINELARREGELEPEALRRTVEEARELADSLKVVLLDHTREVAVRKCLLDTDHRMMRVSLFDDRVNRMEINPCRLPWELVCIEPNGDVKPSSFHHPPVGNLLERDLLEIWNEGLFVELREGSLDGRVCGAEGPVCPRDPGPEGW